MQFEMQAFPGGLAIAGELTVYSAADVRTALLAHSIVGQKLDVDLSQVREFDTAGLQLLMMLKRRSQSQLRIVACSHAVRGVLALFRLDDLIVADDSTQEAA